MRRAFLAFACVALLAAPPALAQTPPSNGMLAAVVDSKLVTVNADGSGQRTLWAPGSGEISGLAWSPDGNRLAMAYGGRIVVYDVAAGRGVTLPLPADAQYANPSWSVDGQRLGFRRIAGGVQGGYTSAPDGSDVRSQFALDALTSDLAFSPDLKRFAAVVPPLLLVSGLNLPLLSSGVVGAPSWSSDSARLAFADATGLSTVPVGLGLQTTPVAAGQFGPPRWAPNGSALVAASGTDLRTIALSGDQRTVLSAGSVGSADWQPCTLSTASCVSISPPRCSTTAFSVATQSDQAVDLPPWPCADPAGLPLSAVIVRAPEHGVLVDRRYTPAAGFTGQDGVTFHMNNGSGDSENVRVTIFVVPRPVAVSAPALVVVARAPFLSARATPRLDSKRTTLVKLACDQDCRFEVRLTARLRSSKKLLQGALVKRSLNAGHVLSLRLRLPRKPKGTAKTVWVTGSVSNASGQSRSIKLPVALPKR